MPHADRQPDQMSVERARAMVQRVLPAWAHDLMVLRHAGQDCPRFADTPEQGESTPVHPAAGHHA